MQANLKTHSKIHTSERPFQCMQCEKKFTYPNNLAIHQRTHTNDRDYKCETCGKCYKIALQDSC